MRTRSQYIGRRFIDGVLVHIFQMGKREANFTGVRGCIIGEWYWCNVKGKRIEIGRTPASCSRVIAVTDEKKLRNWEMLDHLHEERYRRFRESKRANRIFESIISYVDSIQTECKDLSDNEIHLLFECIERRVRKQNMDRLIKSIAKSRNKRK